MIKPGLLCVLGVFLCFHALYGQELPLDELPGLRDKALVLQITTKVAESSKEVWNASSAKVTIPGRPVSIKLVGENLIISVQFTPYFRQGKYTLVAQSQIWINIPDKGMSYKTNTDSISMELGEPILYFPLGSDPDPNNPHIELKLVMYRYGEEPAGVSPQSMAPTETPAVGRGHRRSGGRIAAGGHARQAR
jgi:hypothetical protein